MQSDTCILLPTCERYLSVAELTVRQLPLLWESHPPIFLCGADHPRVLPLRNDPADWMATTWSAVRDLRDRGFSWLYLILDDHPPIGRCDADFLNKRLPEMAARLEATHIGLLGWGQRRAQEGDSPVGGMAGLSRNAIGYRWKFSLHPALWSVPRLLELLEARMSQYSEDARTPWNFERHRDTPDGPVSESLLTSTYRLHGFRACGLPGRTLIAIKEAGLGGYDIFRFLLRILGGQSRRDRFDAHGLWLYHLYCGPYPLFWSGAIRAGKPSPEFQFFFRLLAKRWLLPEWGRLVESFPVR